MGVVITASEFAYIKSDCTPPPPPPDMLSCGDSEGGMQGGLHQPCPPRHASPSSALRHAGKNKSQYFVWQWVCDWGYFSLRAKVWDSHAGCFYLCYLQVRVYQYNKNLQYSVFKNICYVYMLCQYMHRKKFAEERLEEGHG